MCSGEPPLHTSFSPGKKKLKTPAEGGNAANDTAYG